MGEGNPGIEESSPNKAEKQQPERRVGKAKVAKPEHDKVADPAAELQPCSLGGKANTFK